jgi:superfamily II DNA or RNA helicase
MSSEKTKFQPEVAGMEELAEYRRLKDENARLKDLLARYGIPWQKNCDQEQTHLVSSTASGPSQSSPATEKVRLFCSLFRGRSDVYPKLWTSAKGKSGYSPVCANEWLPGVCRKPRVKCADCDQRQLQPLTDQVIYDHLAGKHTVGVYPLLVDETCFFLAVDFDKAAWREDSLAFVQSCRELNIPVALEISRSGNGAHAWFFFADPVPARTARLLGAAIISHACDRSRQIALSSYDRFFPNQDTMPRGGFGNLIALPLQKKPREQGRSVFVDDHLVPHADQWAYLASIQPLTGSAAEEAIIKTTGGRHPLDVAFTLDDECQEPWKRPPPRVNRISGPLPESLSIVVAQQVFIPKKGLPQSLANRLIRTAAFQNPEYYKAQAMRLPVWNKPRIIGCAEDLPRHIGLPRGCLDAVQELLAHNTIRIEMHDERLSGQYLAAKFRGSLRRDQQTAVKTMLKHDIGVLHAPTAFGKTVTAAAIIARRKASTLILVHRKDLLRQWQEQLAAFLDMPVHGLGTMGGGKQSLSGMIDVAVMQSLQRHEDIPGLMDTYGQIIIDECHHISAYSYESLLKQSKARYILGLTATPIRRDGHHPIMFMQCGPIRHSAVRPDTSPAQLEVWPRLLPAPAMPPQSIIQDVFRVLINDHARNQRIAKDILQAFQAGRKVLVLTERTDHLGLLHAILDDRIPDCLVLHGRLSQKQRANVLGKLAELDDADPRVLLATGRLIGEGFDHPPLDTLVLAMPISWKGTLQQYAGRLHRYHAAKRDVRIYEYVEQDHPQLARMWEKRQRGYRSMGYQIREWQEQLAKQEVANCKS